MANPYQVFHSTSERARSRVHIVLVRPEVGGNVGSTARALANMAMNGEFLIVGDPAIVNGEAVKMAVHAAPRLQTIRFFPTLDAALAGRSPRSLALAATARVGSPHRPHPLPVREAMEKAIAKLREEEADSLYLVFGPESDGLTNDEVGLCDWVVTIPSAPGYRSLNLAQATLIFSYEAHLNLSMKPRISRGTRTSQRQRLIRHLLRLAEEVGFILPGDPLKMRPRLEDIFSHLPNHIRDVKTLHGLIDQIIRSVRRGEADLKGRYRHLAERTRDGAGAQRE